MNLSRRKCQILIFIKQFTEQRGKAPTARDIANEFDLTKETIWDHTSKMRKLGLIYKPPYSCGGFRILEKGEDYIDVVRKHFSEDLHKNQN